MTDSGRHDGPSWVRIVVETPAERADDLAALLAELTGAGVEVVTVPEGTGEGLVGLAAYLPAGVETAALEETLRDRLASEAGEGMSAPRVRSREHVPGEEWGRTWKEHFRPARLSRRLVVRPPWEDFAAPGDARVMVIDPGMAFGTGLHPSTRLALSFIDDLYGQPENKSVPFSVLDVGTGTGILAMACALLGARRVLAIDNDPDAVAAARANVAANGLATIVEVSGEDLAAVPGTFDLVTANIVHDALVGLASHLAGHLRPGATLICAGILAGEQEESLRGVLERLGLRHLASRREEEWAAQLFSLDKPSRNH